MINKTPGKMFSEYLESLTSEFEKEKAIEVQYYDNIKDVFSADQVAPQPTPPRTLRDPHQSQQRQNRSFSFTQCNTNSQVFY